MRKALTYVVVAVVTFVGLGTLAWPTTAQGTPRLGGELTFVVPGEPPSYDGHREETFALIHPAAPHYSTLLRVDPFDRSGTKLVGDLAQSWVISTDGRTYTLRLRRGVKFHDGSELTATDVKASYDKIVFPVSGVTSSRKASYVNVESIEAPDSYTVVFRLRWPQNSFLSSLASPYNWIYKAEILARDPRWYETHIMGTGPFMFVEHAKGSYWVGKKNSDYWDKGKPYLDSYRVLFIKDSAAQAAAIRSERAHIQFRGFSPGQRDTLIQAMGERVVVQESPWNCLIVTAINHEKKPFDDRRVRRALTLGLDRYQGSQALSKISIMKEVAGVQVPGTPFATPPQELRTLAGYGRDIKESRAEARRLLREAGVPEGFTFTYKNRGIPMPYEPLAVWLIDQWRQIGLNVRHENIEASSYVSELRRGNFEVAADFQCGYIVEPDLDLYKFQSKDISDANYGRYTDKVLDDLYVKQSRATRLEDRKAHIRAFERRLLDEEAHDLYTLLWHRIILHSAQLRGWTITPSHYLNNQLDTVWLAE